MDKNYSKAVSIWLIAGMVLVAAMVIIGGITRLTHSGLSMVNWNLFMGAIPPLNEQDWEIMFNHYKQYPEYAMVNFHFSLADFKSIFWWEYIHRLLGRIIGLVFLFPYLFFLYKKVFNTSWNKKLIIVFLLGGFQGFLGWYMVKSGLVNMPAVSHYRLAIHLMAAFILFSYLFWLYLDIRREKTNTSFSGKPINILLSLLSFSILIQIIYGAFVAGLKAGLFLNTWPKMGNEWVPSVISFVWKDLGISSFIQDPVMIQFIHRYIPFLILLFIILLLRNSAIKNHPFLRKEIYIMLYIWIGQFTLGVITIITQVPVVMGVLHQFGALILLMSMISLLHGYSTAEKLK